MLKSMKENFFQIHVVESFRTKHIRYEYNKTFKIRDQQDSWSYMNTANALVKP